MNMKNQTLTTKEVAEIFGVKLETYRMLVREDRAPVMPIPGIRQYRYALRQVEAVLRGDAVRVIRKQIDEAHARAQLPCVQP